MTQIVVTIAQDADTGLLQRMIENLKGVVTTSLQNQPSTAEKKRREEWVKKMESFAGSLDPAYIDMNDERTRYILRK